MKKYIQFMLCVLVVIFAGCGKKGNATVSGTSKPASPTPIIEEESYAVPTEEPLPTGSRQSLTDLLNGIGDSSKVEKCPTAKELLSAASMFYGLTMSGDIAVSCRSAEDFTLSGVFERDADTEHISMSNGDDVYRKISGNMLLTYSLNDSHWTYTINDKYKADTSLLLDEDAYGLFSVTEKDDEFLLEANIDAGYVHLPSFIAYYGSGSGKCDVEIVIEKKTNLLKSFSVGYNGTVYSQGKDLASEFFVIGVKNLSFSGAEVDIPAGVTMVASFTQEPAILTPTPVPNPAAVSATEAFSDLLYYFAEYYEFHVVERESSYHLSAHEGAIKMEIRVYECADEEEKSIFFYNEEAFRVICYARHPGKVYAPEIENDFINVGWSDSRGYVSCFVQMLVGDYVYYIEIEDNTKINSSFVKDLGFSFATWLLQSLNNGFDKSYLETDYYMPEGREYDVLGEN